MINKPRNWENVQAFGDWKKIPVGAYICRILRAEVRERKLGQQLCVLFDVAEGDYTGYYRDEFESSTRADKKYKGVLRVFLPTDDGSERDEMTKRSLKGFVTAVEESNPGYTWNWNEASLTNRMIGILLRDEEWQWDGKTGWTARPFRALSVGSVEDGKYTIPKPKPLAGSSAATAPSAAAPTAGFADLADEDDSELPF